MVRQVIGQRPAQSHLPSHHRHELDLCAGQVNRRGGTVEPVDRGTGGDNLGESFSVDDHVIDARDLRVVINPEGGARVPLGVQVNDENGQAGLRQRGGHVHRRGGLAHASLLISHRQDARRRRRRQPSTGEDDAAAGVLRQRLRQRGVASRVRDCRDQLIAYIG